MNKMMRPYLLVLSAYCVWGILPLYWELLSEVSPKLLLVMRAVLSALLLICFELRSGTFLREIKSVLSLRQSFFVVLASLLLLGNWWSYLIAIEQGRFICASLAYFICPMVTFILGYLVLGESLSKAQRIGFSIIGLAVLLKTLLQGEFPGLALFIGGSFSGYVLMHKLIKLRTEHCLLLELLLMSVLVVVLVVATEPSLLTELIQLPIRTKALLALSGFATILPMRWFVRGAQKIPLKDLGMLQYLSPSIMFLLALGFGEERITIADALSFPLLWLGIAVCVGMPFVARMLRMKTSPA